MIIFFIIDQSFLLNQLIVWFANSEIRKKQQLSNRPTKVLII